MDMNRLTERTQEALVGARDLASRQGQQQVEPEHMLLALLEQENSTARAIVEKAGAKAQTLIDRVRQEVLRLPKVSGGGDPHPGSRLNRVLIAAEDEAKKLTDDFVAVEHVVLALLEEPGSTGRLLRDVGLSRDQILTAMREVRGSGRVTSQNAESAYQALEKEEGGRDAGGRTDESRAVRAGPVARRATTG